MDSRTVTLTALAVGALVVGGSVLLWRTLDEARSGAGTGKMGPSASASAGTAAPANPATPSGGRHPVAAMPSEPTGAGDTDRAADPATPLEAIDPDDETAEQLVRHAFEAALVERFPELQLSPEEVDRATRSLIELRRAREALRSLPPDPGHAETRRRLVERIAEATGRFAEVLDMDPGEFTARAEPGTGLDRFDPDEDLPEPEFLEPER